MDRLMYEALAQILANQQTLLQAMAEHAKPTLYERRDMHREFTDAQQLTVPLIFQLRNAARAK